jgi:3-hydroxybutyryl-CoA dehydrogenase
MIALSGTGFQPVLVTLRANRITRMRIAAITERYSEKDLGLFYPGADISWIIGKEIPAPGQHPGVDVYLDLDFANEAQRTVALSRLLPALVMVNAVVPTLGEIGYPFVRLNGWPGWPERPVHELVAPDETTATRVAVLYEQLGHAFRLVPDVPGMISPRILAAIINEAWYTWQEKVSTKEEIDTAMRLGTNYPLGPFEWCERIGIDAVSDLLRSLSRTDARYTPCQAMQEALS